ncbi:MAG: hypothetical protein AAFQ22_13220 [Pseudomonadota bacterium]
MRDETIHPADRFDSRAAPRHDYAALLAHDAQGLADKIAGLSEPARAAYAELFREAADRIQIACSTKEIAQ